MFPCISMCRCFSGHTNTFTYVFMLDICFWTIFTQMHTHARPDQERAHIHTQTHRHTDIFFHIRRELPTCTCTSISTPTCTNTNRRPLTQQHRQTQTHTNMSADTCTIGHRNTQTPRTDTPPPSHRKQHLTAQTHFYTDKTHRRPPFSIPLLFPSRLFSSLGPSILLLSLCPSLRLTLSLRMHSCLSLHARLSILLSCDRPSYSYFGNAHHHDAN